MALAAEQIVDVQDFINSRKVGAFQYLVVALCALTVFLDGYDTQSISFLMRAIRAEMNFPAEHIGPIISAGLVGLAVGALVFGPIADRIGRRWVVIISTAIFGVFTLAAANSTTETQLMAFRFLSGLGFGGAMPNAIALTAEYCPERRRATLVMIMFTGFSFGAAVAGSLAGSLIPVYGWRIIWYIGGALPLVILPIQFFLLPESIRFLVLVRGARERIAELIRRLDPAAGVSPNARFVIAETPPGVPVVQLFQDGRAAGTICLWGMFFLNLLALFFVQNWLPLTLASSGVPASTAVHTAALLQWGGTAAALLTGFIMDRLGGSRVMPFFYFFGCVCVLMLGQFGNGQSAVYAVMAMTFAGGFFVVGGQNCANAYAAMFYPTAMRSSGVGWCLGIGRVGAIIGPLLGQALISRGWPNNWVFGTAAIPLALAGVAVISMGVMYGFGRISEHATVRPAEPVRALSRG